MENNAPKTWFLESILVTIFCCLPLGIVGIIKANKVKKLTAAGTMDEAILASADAKKWVIITAISGIVIIAIYYAWVFYMMKNNPEVINALAQ